MAPIYWIIGAIVIIVIVISVLGTVKAIRKSDASFSIYQRTVGNLSKKPLKRKN